jgi:hypothetical protein
MTPWKRQILTQLNLMGDKPNLQVGCAQGVEGLLPLLPRVELQSTKRTCYRLASHSRHGVLV